MKKLDEISNPNSCLNRATDDEPIFVLKSTDEIAPSIVRTWAIMYHKQKSSAPLGMTPEQRAKFDQAMALAADMDRWHVQYRKSHGQERSPYINMAYAHGAPISKDREGLSSKRIIERLCQLQAMIYEEVQGVEEADCFCESGGFWKSGTEYGGTFEQGYRNDGRAIEFIEAAVEERIARMKKMTPEELRATRTNEMANRLDKINIIAHKATQGSISEEDALKEIARWSGGFAKLP